MIKDEGSHLNGEIGVSQCRTTGYVDEVR